MDAPLDRVKALLAALPREDQAELARYLGDMLVDPDELEARHVASLQADAGGGRSVTFTFRNEWIRCGKETCRCATGRFHGPYTYKYWREGGRLRKAYVGKPGVTRPAGKGQEARARGSSAASSSGRTPRGGADPPPRRRTSGTSSGA